MDGLSSLSHPPSSTLPHCPSPRALNLIMKAIIPGSSGMPLKVVEPWDIYVEQLYPQGHGYPLWQPDFDRAEVKIGDVGWMEQGGFFQLFHAMDDDGRERQIRDAVPDNFEPFDAENLITLGPKQKIMQRCLLGHSMTEPPSSSGIDSIARCVPKCSLQCVSLMTSRLNGTIHTLRIFCLDSTPVLTSAGAQFNFLSNSNQGAVLINSPAAYTRTLKATMRIKKYILANIQSWVDLADKFSLGLQDHDIYFVYGTTKTKSWAVSAFNGRVYRNKLGGVRVKVGPNDIDELSFQMNICGISIPSRVGKGTCKFANSSPISYTHSSGTTTLLLTQSASIEDTSTGSGSGGSNSPEGNQCIFLNYMKTKQRPHVPGKEIEGARGRIILHH